MWPDNDTNVDFINFTGVADTVAELILQADGRPISIGVSGAWGTGKSSLIKLTRASLGRKTTEQRKFVVVEFNAWLYQGYDDARAALVEIIAEALKAESESTGKSGALAKASELLGRVNWLRIAKHSATLAASLFLGLPIGLMGRVLKSGKDAVDGVSEEEAGEAEKVAEGVGAEASALLRSKTEKSPPKEIQGIRDSFEETLKELGVTLVVLIDDLDRCLPETTISTLEAIRLFLFLHNTAFVIAADNEMIKYAVRKHFEGIGDDQLISYFDKLIQVPIRVPPLGTQEVRAYMMLLFADNVKLSEEPQQDKEVKERMRKAVCDQLGKTWLGKRVDRAFMQTLMQNPPVELIEKFDAADRLAPLMTQASGIAGNPRLIKRFLNAVAIRKKLSDALDIGVDEAALAKMQLFERCGNKEAYMELMSKVNEDAAGKPKFLNEWEEKATQGTKLELEGHWDDQFTRDWLVIPPKLGDMDLRGILYVSREHAPIVTPQDRLSSEAAELLAGLIAAPSVSGMLKERLGKIPRPELTVIFDRVLDQARAIQEWGTPPILEAAIVLAQVESSFGDRLAGFLSDRPASQITPAIVAKINAEPWSDKVFAKWNASSVKSPVKTAITKASKQ
ncbi:MAG: P-loop NTPase fold protein [Pirellulales bacterium]|nr:P-loop NTPase fold protein [Pirellulales bacterium]